MKSQLFRILSVCFLLACSLAAFAGRPTVQVVPAGTGILPSSVSGCGFDIGYTPSSNKEKLTTFFDQNGNVKFMSITGDRKLTLVNLTTGKTIDLNISGPAQITQNSDGTFQFVSGGPSIGVFGPDVAPGLPTVSYTIGRVVVIADQDLNPIQVLSVQGTVKDVCVLLS